MFTDIPQLISAVQPDNSELRRRILSVTSVDNRMFILCDPSKERIESYDTMSCQLLEKLNVAGLRDSGFNGIKSCAANGCLYVNDYREDTIYRVSLADDRAVQTWQVDSRPSALSVNSDCNLLVTCELTDKIQEYTTNGTLVREVSVRLNDTRLSPWHSIQLPGDRYAVAVRNESSPGSATADDVVEVDSEGQVVVSYRQLLQSTSERLFKFPLHLAVDEKNDNIFVADCYNHRVVVFNRPSYCASEFRASFKEHRLSRPLSLSFDKTNGRLYVGEYVKGGRVLVFDVHHHHHHHHHR